MTLQENKKYTREITQKGAVYPCADLEGGRGGPDPPPRDLQSLILPILPEMKKLVIFHICALDRPGKIFWIRADTDVRLITHQQ